MTHTPDPSPTPAHAAAAAIVLDDVSYSYTAADAPVLEHISLRVNLGERLGILGPNGAGKTTLVRLLMGMLSPSQGSITIFGTTPNLARTQRWIGYVPQRPTAELAFPLTVEQVVAMPAAIGLAPWKGPDATGQEHIRTALALTGADAFAQKTIGKISGGQLQRAMIARALAGNPRILLLDEPTLGIDISGQQQFADMLTHVQHTLDITVLVVTHDLRTVAAGCDRIACLHRTLHAHVSPEGLSPAVLAEVFKHEVEGIFGEVHIDAHRADECDDPAHTHHHTDTTQAQQGGSDAHH